MGLFGNKSAGDIFSSVKQSVSDSAKKMSDDIKKQNEASKEAKAPVEGAIIRYGVTYLGGLEQYPKSHLGEIGFNILPEMFYLKPTRSTSDWFSDMVIMYDKVSKFEITTRQMTLTEQMLTNDARSLEQDNNIEITYDDENGNEIVLRLEMLTGISVAGQAVKCREMIDLLRQKGILKRLNKASNANTQSSGESITDKLANLAKLKNSGVISEDEFNSKKAELLSKL